ncbi:MAG: BACON domain-containing protein, partial [Terriglobia bacterium]
FLDSSRNGLRYRRLNSSVRGRIVFFVRSGSVECSYAALSIDEIFPWQGGTGSTQVASPGGCGWTATSNSGFITITSSADSGSGFVEYLVAPNRGSRPRTGTLTVAGEVITVAQEAFATLRVTPPTIELSSVEGTFPNRVAFRVEPIEESVDWSASARLLNGEVWRFRATPASGTATKAAPSIVTLELNPAFPAPLPGVVYEAILTVRDTVEGPSVDVPLILAVSPRSGNLQLSQSAFVFRVAQGGTPAPQTLFLTNSGEGSLSWTIELGSLLAAPWLNFTALAGSAVTGSPTVSSTTVEVNPAGLAPGVYQALVPFSAAGGTNDPQLVTVTLHVVPAAAQPLPALSPGAMVFVAREGGDSPVPQNLTLSNLGSGSLNFRLGVQTFFGGNWLSVSTGSGDASSPVAAQVSANAAGLPPGIYRGRIVAEFSAGGALDVQVALVVPQPGQRTLFGTTVCTPQGIDVLVTSLAGSTAVPVSFPQSLGVRMVDTCGEPVNNALVLVGVEANRFALRPVGRGLYAGTWTPQLVASSVPLRFIVIHPLHGFLEFIARVATQEPPGGATLPAIAADGVVDAASFTQRLPLAPGSVMAVFGSRLATEQTLSSRIPLDRQLAGVSVRIGGEDAPIYAVGPDQINAQVPFTARPGNLVSIVVNSGGKLSAPQNVLIAPVQPSIFQEDGNAFATDQQGRRITSQNPARVGQLLQIFATGLGLVEPAVATGAGAPASTAVLSPVRVTIGGIDAPVGFQGLAPGSAGLYQINVTVPGLVRPGEDVPILLRQDGIPSNGNSPVIVPVRLP